MLDQLLMLAQDLTEPEPLPDQSFLQMEWYSWAGIIAIPVILILYKMYKAKTMT